MHKYVTLVANVLFVKGLSFLLTSSRRISLITIEFLPLQTAKRLALTLEQVIRVYGVAGFIVQVSLMDMEFAKLKSCQISQSTSQQQESMEGRSRDKYK